MELYQVLEQVELKVHFLFLEREVYFLFLELVRGKPIPPEKEGFDRKLEREIRLGEYIERNPTASYAEAAEHFGVREGRIKGTPGANQLLANHVVSDKRRNWEQERKEEIEIDQDMYSRVCVRPTDYVVDVRSRGWLGVVLPEEEFKRYLECYTRYRCGKVDSTTRHLKPQGVFNYNGRRK